MKRFASTLGATLLIIGLLASATLATQVIYRTPRQLGQESELVVGGEVKSVRSYWNDSHSKILTEAIVGVNEAYKGRAASDIRVVQLGGVVDNVRMTVHGALAWHPGEEVLLFLEPATPGAYQVAGMMQGKYLIERDPRSNKAYVLMAPAGDAELVGAPDGSVPTSSTKSTLDEFLADVFGGK